jgi:hypothetical protein
MTIRVIHGATLDTEATIDALTIIADNLRASDRAEVAAMSGLEPLNALVASWMLSTHAYLVLGSDGVPVAAFGAAPHHLPGVGVVWMLGTDGIEAEARAIARQTRKYFDDLNAAYGLLFNYIDNRNTTSIRWLKWGGFRVLGPAPQQSGLDFSIFARTNQLV